MECQSCSDALTAYMDGELTKTELASLTHHLNDCRSCREEYESLEFSYQLTEATLQIEPGDYLWQEIQNEIGSGPMTGIRRGSFWNRWLGRLWVPVSATVTAALLFFALLPDAPSTPSAAAREQFRQFLQQREQLSEENQRLWREAGATDHHTVGLNPFVKPVNHEINVFLQE